MPKKNISKPVVVQKQKQKPVKAQNHKTPPAAKKDGTRGTMIDDYSKMIEVQRAILAGEKRDSICKRLKLSKKTYYKDQKRIFEDRKKELLDDSNKILAQFATKSLQRLNRLDELKGGTTDNREIIKDMLKDDKATVRAAAMQAITSFGGNEVGIIKVQNDMHNSFFDRLQSAGFLPKVTEKLDVSGEMDIKLWMAQFYKPVDKKPIIIDKKEVNNKKNDKKE